MTGAITLAATADTGTGEAVVFWLLAPVATLAAAGMLLARKAVHSALLLALTMLCLAVFYIAQDASFLGVVQVVVYTGAVMMLFLFVLMLVGVDSADSLVETLRGQRIAALLAGVGFAALVIFAIGDVVMDNKGLQAANADGNVPGLANLMFSKLRARVRGHQRAAHHRRARRHDAGAPRADRGPAESARPVRAPVPAAKPRAAARSRRLRTAQRRGHAGSAAGRNAVGPLGVAGADGQGRRPRPGVRRCRHP